MSPKSVRISLWTTGMISFLVLILYLPVLIWSPPWGEDGYYLDGYFDYSSMETEWTTFKGGAFKRCSVYGYDFQIDNTLNFKEKHGHRWVLTPAKWAAWQNMATILRFQDDHMIYTESVRIENDVITKDLTTSEEYYKTSNPFTLWYIKWLEWTAD